MKGAFWHRCAATLLFFFIIGLIYQTRIYAGNIVVVPSNIPSQSPVAPTTELDPEENRENLKVLKEEANLIYGVELKKGEKEVLRQRWEDTLGIDIFFLYFKLKDAEHWVKERTKIKIGNLEGKAQFKKNSVRYVFRIRF